MDLTAIPDLVQTFPHAIVAGAIAAFVCAFLGVFVVLKRVVFIGITLSEVAACGIAAAMLAGAPPFLGAGLFTLITVALLSIPLETTRIPRDAVLGFIFVLASGASILLVSHSGFGLHDIKSLLYGDLILTSPRDLTIVLITLLPVCAYLLLFMRPTLYTFLDREAARVSGVRVFLWELLFFSALGLAVAAASKVTGALLVFCYLVVAPSAALLLSRRLWIVIVLAGSIAVIATLIGILYSFSSDLPTNPAVAVTTCAAFVAALLATGIRIAWNRARGLRTRTEKR